MATDEINEYYEDSEHSNMRSDLQQGIDLASHPRIAIDCGCGAGSNIAHLLKNNFTVHAFDIEPEAISRCNKRFEGEAELFLSQDSFSTFTYPPASLVLADASLFFCPEVEFTMVWRKIAHALQHDGIFVGSFLGPRDSMASSDFQKDTFWPEVLVFTEPSLEMKFAEFDIINWTEHELDSETAQGVPHHWHIYSVVAKKKAP
jgi:SAM-dependent methyltransferase